MGNAKTKFQPLDEDSSAYKRGNFNFLYPQVYISQSRMSKLYLSQKSQKILLSSIISSSTFEAKIQIVGVSNLLGEGNLDSNIVPLMKTKAFSGVHKLVLSTNSPTKRTKQEYEVAMEIHPAQCHASKKPATCKPLSHEKEGTMDEEGSCPAEMVKLITEKSSVKDESTKRHRRPTQILEEEDQTVKLGRMFLIAGSLYS